MLPLDHFLETPRSLEAVGQQLLRHVAVGVGSGEERRLEWADSMTRIRSGLELPDLRYRVERQRPLVSIPGKPAPVEFYASTMRVELALLHEGDLLSFLADLRASGNAYYSVRSCSLARTGAPSAATGLAPRLRAECEIDLITIVDRAAKT